ncbi:MULTISPECIES: hypothetical protein [unclassified Agromyces]|uniref:hypothetical protein n=1 Tax=unclassified Agromyces TaxID=2639701 RepID=UPI0030153A45
MWEALAAIGTLAAVFVSVTFGVSEGFSARRARSELRRAAEEAAEKERQAAERERFAVASLVTAWVTDRYEPDPNRQSYQRSVTLHVANESNEPVVDATVNVFLGQKSRLIGPLAAPTPIPVIPPRREFRWDIATGVAAFEDNMQPLVGLGFTDARGRRWFRDLDGGLSETTGKEVFHYAQEDPEAAQRQVGVIDPSSNPMTVALLFAEMLWLDRAEFRLTDFLPLLDPVATGWQGEWNETRVDELRVLLADCSNVAALAWYSAPKVAYARVFSDRSLKQVSLAGASVAVDGCFITLVHRDGLGWRVFGVGPRFRPDEIWFPEFASEERDHEDGS